MLLEIDFDTGEYRWNEAQSAITGITAFDSSLKNLRGSFDIQGYAYVSGRTNMIE